MKLTHAIIPEINNLTPATIADKTPCIAFIIVDKAVVSAFIIECISSQTALATVSKKPVIASQNSGGSAGALNGIVLMSPLTTVK